MIWLWLWLWLLGGLDCDVMVVGCGVFFGWWCGLFVVVASVCYLHFVLYQQKAGTALLPFSYILLLLLPTLAHSTTIWNYYYNHNHNSHNHPTNKTKILTRAKSSQNSQLNYQQKELLGSEPSPTAPKWSPWNGPG